MLSEQENQEAREKWGSAFRVGMGAEAIQELLKNIDLEKEYHELRDGLEGATGQKRARIVKRLEVVEAFREPSTISKTSCKVTSPYTVPFLPFQMMPPLLPVALIAVSIELRF